MHEHSDCAGEDAAENRPTARYLIGSAAPEVLAQIAALMQANSGMDLIQVQGGMKRPTLLVAHMTDGRAEELRKMFPQATIERDELLGF